MADPTDTVATVAPRESSTASTDTPPGRSRRTVPSASTDRIVDSSPTAQAPPSRTASIRPDSPAITCAALVGLIRPDGLAEGAATGPPKARSSACATGCAGTRTPRVGNPAVTRGAIPDPARNGRTRVIGPGQCAAASRSATGGT